MHSPRRADLAGSSQAAREQFAQPEETPPRLAGNLAIACSCAISRLADCSAMTDGPTYFLQNLDDRGKQARATPRHAHIIHEEPVIARRK